MKKISKALYILAGLALLYWMWLMLLLFLSFSPVTKPLMWLLLLAFPTLLVLAHRRQSSTMMIAGLIEFLLAAAIFQTL